jgi:hypothetical protein
MERFEMKKTSVVLLLWLCACCLVFVQGCSKKTANNEAPITDGRSVLSGWNEAVDTIGKGVPSGWTLHDGMYWKSYNDIAVGKEWTALQLQGTIVEQAIVGCVFANNSDRTRWLKESYDTLIAGKWELVMEDADSWIFMKEDILAAGVINDSDGTISASVVFMAVSAAWGATAADGHIEEEDYAAWTAVDVSRIFDDISAIAYGNGKFLAGGKFGRMFASTDGTNWTNVNNNGIFAGGAIFDPGYVYAIAYGNNMFVAGGQGEGGESKMATSTDGTAWTEVDISRIFEWDVKAIALAVASFVAGGSRGKMATSTNGTAWTAVDVSRIFGTDWDASISAIAFGNDRFVAGGTRGKMATSINGTAWTAVDVSRIFGDYGMIYAIAYGNGRFVAGGGGMATSTDGTAWTAVDVSGIFTEGINAITFGNDRFVAGGNDGKMATSTDGTTWTALEDSNFGDFNINAIAYGSGKFVAGYEKQSEYIFGVQ